MKAAIMFLCISFSISWVNVSAQSDEAQQLLLNVEKLAQFKEILRDMKKGYEIVSNGYNTIKDISKGSFNLHDAFLNALLQISPTVKKYARKSINRLLIDLKLRTYLIVPKLITWRKFIRIFLTKASKILMN
jgi:hypothetical protein